MSQRKTSRGHRNEPAPQAFWLYGRHPVLAALGNPGRRCRRLLAVEPKDPRLAPLAAARQLTVEAAAREQIAHLVPGGAPHQGIGLLVEPLDAADLKDVCANSADSEPVVVLDQVTDPHNVGAILRSAAAFGARAVVLTQSHAPPETGVLARAASGALDRVPLLRVANLARALDDLAGLGYWRIGLSEDAQESMAVAKAAGRLSGGVALVLGAEGAGLRRLTAERCDFLLRLPTLPAMPSLNVSNAAAIALYELVRP